MITLLVAAPLHVQSVLMNRGRNYNGTYRVLDIFGEEGLVTINGYSYHHHNPTVNVVQHAERTQNPFDALNLASHTTFPYGTRSQIKLSCQPSSWNEMLPEIVARFFVDTFIHLPPRWSSAFLNQTRCVCKNWSLCVYDLPLGYFGPLPLNRRSAGFAAFAFARDSQIYRLSIDLEEVLPPPASSRCAWFLSTTHV